MNTYDLRAFELLNLEEKQRVVQQLQDKNSEQKKEKKDAEAEKRSGVEKHAQQRLGDTPQRLVPNTVDAEEGLRMSMSEIKSMKAEEPQRLRTKEKGLISQLEAEEQASQEPARRQSQHDGSSAKIPLTNQSSTNLSLPPSTNGSTHWETQKCRNLAQVGTSLAPTRLLLEDKVRLLLRGRHNTVSHSLEVATSVSFAMESRPCWRAQHLY